MNNMGFKLPGGWLLHHSYNTRKTAESIADCLRRKEWQTRIVRDQYGNHLVYKRRHKDILSRRPRT